MVKYAMAPAQERLACAQEPEPRSHPIHAAPVARLLDVAAIHRLLMSLRDIVADQRRLTAPRPAL